MDTSPRKCLQLTWRKNNFQKTKKPPATLQKYLQAYLQATVQQHPQQADQPSPQHPQHPQLRWSLPPAVPGLPGLPALAPEDLAALALPRELWLEALHTRSSQLKGVKRIKKV